MKYTFIREIFIHECASTGSGSLVMLDVSKTPDCGWEGAYAIFNENTFRDWWYQDGVRPYTYKDVLEWGEEAEAFYGWTVVSSRHRKPEIAEKKLRQHIASI